MPSASTCGSLMKRSGTVSRTSSSSQVGLDNHQVGILVDSGMFERKGYGGLLGTAECLKGIWWFVRDKHQVGGLVDSGMFERKGYGGLFVL
jgi:hypothetical protein